MMAKAAFSFPSPRTKKVGFFLCILSSLSVPQKIDSQVMLLFLFVDHVIAMVYDYLDQNDLWQSSFTGIGSEVLTKAVVAALDLQSAIVKYKLPLILKCMLSANKDGNGNEDDNGSSMRLDIPTAKELMIHLYQKVGSKID